MGFASVDELVIEPSKCESHLDFVKLKLKQSWYSSDDELKRISFLLSSAKIVTDDDKEYLTKIIKTFGG